MRQRLQTDIEKTSKRMNVSVSLGKMAGRMLYLLVVVLVMVWAFSEVAEGGMSRPRKKRPKKKEEPVDPDPPESNIEINQMMGKWYLLNVGTKCSHLMTQGTKVEATTMTLAMTTSGTEQKLSVITKTRHNHQCWEIQQVYDFTQINGYFIIKGNSPKLDTKVTILDTDYTSYAIFAYEKLKKITMKLYTRSVEKLSEPVLLKFENFAAKKNIGLAFMFPFPTYSHCDTVEQDHIINCIPTC